MRKFLIAFILFLGIVSSISLSCYTPDSNFKLKIYNLSIDFDRLIKICTRDTCKITSEYISTKSTYDERVGLIFWLDGTLEIITPFYQDESGELKPIEIDPETYNWKESVKKDLETLIDMDIIKKFTITNIEIDRISSIAKNGKNIYYCNNWWKAFETNCRCPTEEEKRLGNLEEICFRCFRNESSSFQLPSKSILKSEKLGIKNEEKVQVNLILLIILLVAILSIILFVATRLMRF
jgi:hypothetical protein